MNLPLDFENYLKEHLAAPFVTMILEGLQTPSPTSIRLNKRRLRADVKVEGALGSVPWCSEGIYLRERPAFTADPAFHGGGYYVQEASSMFLDHVLRSLVKMSCKRALDLCAAPGGKSTIVRSFLPDDSLLVCNEPIRNRAQILAENMKKWGHPHVAVTQAYPSNFTDFIEDFDLIIADVPCSGEGMFRKEEDAVTGWTPAAVSMCAERQRNIIETIWPTLKPGGLLLYSTCTFNPEEDEDNVDWIAAHLGAKILEIPVEASWNIVGDMRKNKENPSLHQTTSCRYAHFLPGQVQGEGFFLAVLQKEGEWCETSEEPDAILPLLPLFQERRNEGEEPSKNKRIGPEKKNKKASKKISDAQTIESKEIPSYELSLDEAFRYLKGESLVLPESLPKGLVTVKYQGLELGQVNHIGNRANNLYPREWRIRSSYIKPHSILVYQSPA